MANLKTGVSRKPSTPNFPKNEQYSNEKENLISKNDIFTENDD